MFDVVKAQSEIILHIVGGADFIFVPLYIGA